MQLQGTEFWATAGQPRFS